MTEPQVVRQPEDFATAHRASLKQKQLKIIDIFGKIKFGVQDEDTMDDRGFMMQISMITRVRKCRKKKGKNTK